MSNEAFPVIYCNMAGEMVYIVEQRLMAQSIDTSKADKVLDDILTAMFNPGLINEVFKKQQLLTVYALRQMFEKLAHSSIMKLNEQSMNKLFDLMVMVTKYQIIFCNTPVDLIHVTLNHLDSLCQMARQEETLKLVESTKEKFITIYMNMNCFKLQDIRYTILTFLQDIKTRVSIFLRDKTQENSGSFVIKAEGIVSCDCQIPGTIKYFDHNLEITETDRFDALGHYIVCNDKTTLGLNIYSKEYSKNDSSDKQTSDGEPNDEKDICNESAKNELNLLAKLIGREKTNETEIDFYLNLGNDETITEKSGEKSVTNVNEVNICEGIHKNINLENIINDLNIDVNIDVNSDVNPSNDFLELMDS